MCVKLDLQEGCHSKSPSFLNLFTFYRLLGVSVSIPLIFRRQSNILYTNRFVCVPLEIWWGCMWVRAVEQCMSGRKENCGVSLQTEIILRSTDSSTETSPFNSASTLYQLRAAQREETTSYLHTTKRAVCGTRWSLYLTYLYSSSLIISSMWTHWSVFLSKWLISCSRPLKRDTNSPSHTLHPEHCRSSVRPTES